MLQRLPSQLETPRGSKFQNHPSSIFSASLPGRRSRPRLRVGLETVVPAAGATQLGLWLLTS